jgi:hypothetical protein
MNKKEFRYLSTLTHRVSRYEAYCASLAAHGGNPSLQLSPRGGEGDRSLSLRERVRERVGSASEWNDHSSLSRLALHRDERALHFAQLRFLG